MNEKEVKVKLNNYFAVDGKSKITPENLPVESTEADVKSGNLVFNGKMAGLRVNWDGTDIVIEERDTAGDWKRMGGVQNLTIEFSVDLLLPKVKIERIIF